MNKVIISGNLGQKPEIRDAKSGVKVGNFSVATNSRVKKGDEWVDHTVKASRFFQAVSSFLLVQKTALAHLRVKTRAGDTRMTRYLSSI